MTDVVGAYHRAMADVAALEQVGEAGTESEGLAIESVTVTADDGTEPMLWSPMQRAHVTIVLRAESDTREGVVGWRIVKDGAGMVARWVAQDGPFVPALKADETVTLSFDMTLAFAGGGYLLDLAIGPADYRTFMLSENNVYRFGIADRPGGQGITDIDPTFRVAPG